MRFTTWIRGTAAVVGAALIVASGAAPTLAASAHDSIVQLDALDGQWVVQSETSDANLVLAGHVFVSKGMVVIVFSGGLPAQADFVATTADTVASAQEASLSPGA